MGKNKLKKFAEMRDFACTLQYPREELIKNGFPYRGSWNAEFFKREAPIVVELGCGKGEYTVGLAKSDATRNYIGVDIKGARIWRGAKTVEEEGITNAAFLRAEIENIDKFFEPGEVEDSPFLYEYTRRMVKLNNLEILADTDDLYGSGQADPVTSIKTFYEQQWLSRGKKIKLLSFRLPAEGELVEPQIDDIERDDYHAVPRFNPTEFPNN